MVECGFDWSVLFGVIQVMLLFGECQLIELCILLGKFGKEGVDVLKMFVVMFNFDVLMFVMLLCFDVVMQKFVWFIVLQNGGVVLKIDLVDCV